MSKRRSSILLVIAYLLGAYLGWITGGFITDGEFLSWHQN